MEIQCDIFAIKCIEEHLPTVRQADRGDGDQTGREDEGKVVSVWESERECVCEKVKV